MKHLAIAMAAAIVVSASVTALAAAKQVTPQMEVGRTLKDRQAIHPGGDAPFGESINPTTGELSFSHADVVLEGTGPAIRLVRTTRTQQHDKAFDPPAFGNWDLSVPRIETMLRIDPRVAASPGERWRVGHTATLHRCTQFESPRLATDAWWHGYDFITEDGGRQLLLRRGAENTIPRPTMREGSGATMVFPAVTLAHWQVGCRPNTANGEAGESFLAVSPDGTKYFLDHLVASQADAVREDDPDAELVHRVFASMLATRIEDRFGNWVRYTYDGKKLTSIASNDGRAIAVAWHAAYPVVASITAMPGTPGQRTWRYEYTFDHIDNTTVISGASLAAVQRPDGSTWRFSGAVSALDGPLHDTLKHCTTRSGDQLAVHGPAHVATVTSPSGAVGRFVRKPVWRARSHVPSDCRQDPVSKVWHETAPPMFGAYVLTERTISGPGVPARTWTYAHAVAQASAARDACVASGTCATESWVDIRDPEGNRTRHVHATRWGIGDGRVVRTEVYQGESSLLRTTRMTYAHPEQGPWPKRLGLSRMVGRTNVAKLEQLAPLVATTIEQQGRTFASTVQAFDVFARPTKVLRSSGPSPSYSRTDTQSYDDHLALWVVGQPKASTNLDSGLVESETRYDAATALPIRTYRFGKLQQAYAYYGNGTMKSSSDGRDAVVDTTIAYSSWKRGLPQRIDFPDGTWTTATVDDFGQVREAEDENRFQTCYDYDIAGQLTLIAYPSEASGHRCDRTATHWFATTRTFEQVDDRSEYGLAPGHWREFVRTSRNHRYVYYDALWRPVLTRIFGADNAANTLSQTVTRYDAHGRTSFQSYPTRASIGAYTDALPGTRTTHDALGRATRVEQDAEAEDAPDRAGGLAVSKTEYLDDFTTRHTNPRNQVTLTRYRTLDTPTTESPSVITHANGATTDIHRNTFGLPTTLTRRDATTSLSRTYAYNAAMELCRVVEPETGATLNGYDGAGNLAWSAAGLASNSMCDAEGDTPAILARKVERAYDNRNRIARLSFPDGRGNTTYAYTADGLPASVVVNNWSTNAVHTHYAYNARRLLTSETMVWDAITWPVTHGYNKYGHLLVQGYPGSVNVHYAPNALGQATQAGAYATGVTYHPNGAIAGFTYGNGILRSLTQNTRQLPLRSRDALGAVAILDDSYDYDRNGNVLAISDGIAGHRGNRDMAYDAMNQLIEATSTTMFGGAIRYTYDAHDNIATLVAPGRNLRYCYNGRNQLAFIRTNAPDCTSGAATTTLAYDAQGNVAGNNNIAYDFDFGNRLRSVTDGATTTTYVYDAAGRRVRDITGASKYSLYTQAGQLAYTSDARKRETTHYIHLGGSLVATRSVPFASNVATVEYQHTDALGTPVVVTNAAGAVVQRSEYEPYGRVLNRAVEDGPGFTGHFEDGATGLVYMQQRYFDTKSGRFISLDPIAVRTLGDNFNRYWYANNSPYTLIDPDGRESATLQRDEYRLAQPDVATTQIAVGLIADFTPGIGDAKGFYEAYRDPSWSNVSAAGVGLIPFVGDAVGKAIKSADEVADAAKASDSSRFAPGPFAGESIPARSSAQRFNVSERRSTNQIGSQTGCHSCGVPHPGTKTGNFVPDHQPVSSLNTTNAPQRLYPQCLACSQKQGLEAIREIRSRK
jgi:RHS repeat-associated protein